MQQRIQNIGDVIDFVRRRKKAILIPFTAVFAIAGTVAFVLPPIYRSSSTILIEGQQVPPDFVQSTVNTLVEETIQTINHRIMSRRKLEDIIARFNLYEALLKRKTLEEVLERMREDIKLKTISAEVINPRSGQPGVATIAFSLSYEGEEPGKVQKVANTLASLYLEENLKTREERAKTTADFMESELDALNQNINDLEARVAKFKEEHLEALPEMAQFNFQMTQRLEQQIEGIERDLRALEERKVYLSGQLAGIDPDDATDLGMASPRTRLRVLYTQFATAKATLLENHPDVIRLQKEIASLEQEVNLDDAIKMKMDQLESLKAELVAMEGSLSPQHPDVKNARKSIVVLEQEIDLKLEEGSKGKPEALPPGNPAYLNISTQIETTDIEMRSLREEKKRLAKALEGHRQKLALTPKIELEYRMLTRDYENARVRYQETLNKLMVAKSAQGLEKDQKGQRFTIIDPAILPEKPFKPNRLAIVVVGFLLGIGAGIGVAALREVSDHAVRSEGLVAYLTEKPVLAVIPLIVTTEDLKGRTRKRVLVGLSATTAMALCVVAVHLFYRPLDVLWFQVMRKLVSMGIMSP